MCLIIGNINIDYLVKGVSARFFHLEVAIFFSIINKNLVVGGTPVGLNP